MRNKKNDIAVKVSGINQQEIKLVEELDSDSESIDENQRLAPMNQKYILEQLKIGQKYILERLKIEQKYIEKDIQTLNNARQCIDKHN